MYNLKIKKMSDQVTPNSFKKFLGTLLNHLCKYDAGYGLYYFVQKHFASPLNHDCRIYRQRPDDNCD